VRARAISSDEIEIGWDPVEGPIITRFTTPKTRKLEKL
jgi:hypothetical protein